MVGQGPTDTQPGGQSEIVSGARAVQGLSQVAGSDRYGARAVQGLSRVAGSQ